MARVARPARGLTTTAYGSTAYAWSEHPSASVSNLLEASECKRYLLPRLRHKTALKGPAVLSERVPLP
jgi:hypothetical protein